MTHEPHLEEQAAAEALKATLSTQLDAVENLAVDIKTDLLKLLQGKVSSLALEGDGIVKEGIHIEHLEVQTDQVSIDPLSAILGEIRLNKPVDTDMRAVLTEADLNQAMNSEQIISKIPALTLKERGRDVLIELCPPFAIRLLSDTKLRFTGIAKIHRSQPPEQVAFTSVIYPRTETQPILMETFSCGPNQGVPLPLMVSLLSYLENLVTQPYFELDNVTLRVKSLRIQGENLILEIKVHANQIPAL